MLNGFYTCIDRKMNNLLYRGYNDKGQKIYNTYRFRPTVYLESKDKNTKWKSLEGIPLEPMRFESMSECREFSKSYEGVNGFKIYGNERHIPAFIQAEFPDSIQFDKRLIDICYLDLECPSGVDGAEGGFPKPDEAKHPIVTITIKSSRNNKYIAWGLKNYDVNASIVPHLQKEYRQFETESEMLDDFLNWWSDTLNTPDIITGWNTLNFDIPYLVNRISRILGNEDVNRLSPWKQVDQKSKTFQGQTNVYYEILGIQQLDYLDLFKKFTLNTYGQQESYKLDNIAELVLGENKLDYGEHSNLTKLYEHNFQHFLDYNIKDVELVERLEAKLGLLNLVFTLSYFAGVNYTETLGTVALWDSIIFRKLAKQRIAIPPSAPKASVAYPGGYVKDPAVGMHEWVLSFDLNSLYPSLIMQYNMSPETLVRHMTVPGLDVDRILREKKNISPEPNLATAANGACFRRDKQGFMPQIVEELYSKRVLLKKQMIDKKKQLETIDAKGNSKEYFAVASAVDRLETEQMAIKILLNSLYGAIGNRFFRYFDLAVAEGITLTGQLVIKWAEENFNSHLSNFLKDEVPKDRVIMMDTDSCYISVKDVIDKFNPKNPVMFLDEFAKKSIEPMLEKAFAKFAIMTNAYDNKMVMKRESISNRGIVIAKKRYILNVHNNEGVQYTEPKIKMMGVEAIKSSTPKVCRAAFKEIFKVIMNENELKMQQSLAMFKTYFSSLPPEVIASPRGVSNIKKWKDKGSVYIKGTPMNSRAALMHNHLCVTKGLQNQYQLIQGGDKIKYIYLKKQNPTNENVIGFIDTLPVEFGLKNFIDYDLQFKKTFVEPLQLILDSIGWKPEPVSSLEDFFC
jgi:DNA polymerase elongation subunit (family B)